MNNDWFRHDYNAHEDIKQKRLLKAKGLAALGLYWYLVECLYQNNGQMSDKEIRLEAELMDGLDYLDALIEYELLSFGNGVWTCRRVTDELRFKEERKQKKSDAGKKGMASRWGDGNAKKDSDTTVDNNLITSDNTVITSDNETKKSITNDNTLTNTITNKEKDNIPYGISSKKKDTENDQNDTLFSVEKAKDDTPYEEIMRYWNERAAKNNLSQCIKITDQRKQHINNRWNEYGDKVFEAIDKVMASDFCKSGSWCGFDWVFKPSNMIKIIEGTYDNRKGYGANTGKKFSPTDLSGQYSGYKAKKVQI